MGAIPNIAFSDYENQSVSLVQDSIDGECKGHMTFPIKDEKNNKIGILKVNVTAGAVAVGPDHDSADNEANRSKMFNTSVVANNNSDVLYGGLFQKSIANGWDEPKYISIF